jgi:hypothetical protein
MKKNTDKKETKETIGRRKALLRTGKYAAFTAAAMMILMSPLHSDGAVTSNRGVPHRLPKKR